MAYMKKNIFHQKIPEKNCRVHCWSLMTLIKKFVWPNFMFCEMFSTFVWWHRIIFRFCWNMQNSTLLLILALPTQYSDKNKLNQFRHRCLVVTLREATITYEKEYGISLLKCSNVLPIIRCWFYKEHFETRNIFNENLCRQFYKTVT